MKIPKTFYLKGNRWTVKRKKSLKHDDGDECSGLTDTETRTIYLDKDLSEPSIFWVFWHEYGHAMLHESGVTGNTGGLSDLAEEIVCDNFADVMTLDKEIKFKRRKQK